ncbi:MAG: hypothetical protein AAGH65_01315, partial [Pseudomonadota bacterium]
YALLGNYLYFSKILPAFNNDTGDAAPRFLPSGQLSQIKGYLSLLEKEQKRPWYYYFLKNLAGINALLLLAIAPLFLKIIGAY